MPDPSDTPERTSCVQIEANVDDLDPRVWPHAIERLLAAGADDAWITPISMKKGRPAFTLGVLCSADVAETVRSVVFTETSTIGLREWAVTKYALPRSSAPVEVDGETIDTKVAFLDGEPINQSIEWDDVVRAAAALGLSPKQTLAAAVGATRDGPR